MWTSLLTETRIMNRFAVRSIGLVAGVLFLFLQVGVLFGQEKKEKPLPEKSRKKFRKLTEKRRGLEMRYQVPMKIMNRTYLRQRMKKDVKEQIPPGLARRWERTLVTLGVFPEDRDLLKTVWEFLGDQVGGFYDDRVKELFLVENPEGMRREVPGMEPNEFVSVHELTHALQDQHFDLGTLPMSLKHQDDLTLAIQALVEGDASYVQYDHMMQKRGMSLEQMSSMMTGRLKQGFNRPGAASPGSGDSPLFLRKSFTFPYTAGLLFVMEARRGSWDKVNKMYADPPTSTEQILHPEKYYKDRDKPVVLTQPSLDKKLGEEWSLQDWNTLGEYGVHLLFLEFFPKQVQQIIKARSGWGGDRYHSYYNEDEDRTSVSWFTTWDEEKDADEFFDLYKRLLDTRYSEKKTLTDGSEKYVIRTDGTVSYLEKRNRDVLVLENVKPDEQDLMVRRIWSDTERENGGLPKRLLEQTKISFDADHLTLNRSSSDRVWWLKQNDSFRFKEDKGMLFARSRKQNGLLSVELLNLNGSGSTVSELANETVEKVSDSAAAFSLLDKSTKKSKKNGTLIHRATRTGKGKSSEMGTFRFRVSTIRAGGEAAIFTYLSTPEDYEKGLDQVLNLEQSLKLK